MQIKKKGKRPCPGTREKREVGRGGGTVVLKACIRRKDDEVSGSGKIRDVGERQKREVRRLRLEGNGGKDIKVKFGGFLL